MQSINLTYSGGSSSVLSRALKLCVDSICTSSIKYILKRALVGLYGILSSKLRISSTLVCDAASISIRSIYWPIGILVQAEHSPHGLLLILVSQFRHLARILAMLVLPTPRVPVKR